MPLKSLFAACLILSVASVTACNSDNTDKDNTKESSDSIYCNESADCPTGMGCVKTQNVCVSLTASRNCIQDRDCTEEQICVRLSDSNAEETKYKNSYCSFECTTTQDCLKWGKNSKCSTEQKSTDYNHPGDFCTNVPATCRNGVLDEGEVCDVDPSNGNSPIFAEENVSCSNWQEGVYKDGGKPGCAKTCMGYTKGSGKTKCAFATDFDNIEGINTCYASLFIDDDAKYAYATVNYSIYLSASERASATEESVKAQLDKVKGAILCSQKNIGSGILVTSQNIPEFTSTITSYNTDTYSATMSVERNLTSLASAYANDGVCVVYLQLENAASGKGVICNINYSSNGAGENLRECFSDELASQNDDIKNDQDVDQSEIVYDFPIYQPLVIASKCTTNMYPYVSFGSSGNHNTDPEVEGNLKAFMVWDAFPKLMTNEGYPEKDTAVLEMMNEGLDPDSGVCQSNGVCSNPKLKLSKKSNIQKIRVTKDQTGTESQVFGTLMIGPVDEKFDSADPGKTSFLSISASGLEEHSHFHLTIVGNTLSLNTKTGNDCGKFNDTGMGKLAITYIDANGESLLAQDVILPDADTPSCCDANTPAATFCGAEAKPLDPDCKDPEYCLDVNAEVKRTFVIPETVKGLKEIRIYMYDQPEKNFRFNTIRVDAVSSEIL